MLKFLRTRAVSMQNACLVSNTKCSKRVCSFCNYYHFKPPKPIKYIICSHYVTDTAELHTSLKKKIKNRFKRHVELLEDQTSYRKAVIHKLNFAHVSNLVSHPDTTLEKLNKISNSNIHKKTHSTQAKDINSRESHGHNTNKLDDVHYSILKEAGESLEDRASVAEQLKDSGISDNTVLIKNSAFMDTLHGIQIDDKDESKSNNFTHEYEKPNNVMIPFKKEDHSFLNSLSDHNLMLHYTAQIDVYLQVGMPNRSFNMLLSKNQFKGKKILSAGIYNMLLEVSISKSYLEKVFEIYKFINEHSVFIKPNAQTFALMFQAIENIKAQGKQLEIAKNILKDMERNGIVFDDILNQTKLNTTQLEAVHRFIRLVAPEYRITYRDIDTTYNCKLLQNLKNNNNRSNPAQGVVTLDELQKMMRTQIDMESQHELKVKSIAKFNENADVRQYSIERIAEWEKSWKSSVDKAFEKNVDYLKRNEIAMQNDLFALYPFLQVLPKEEYVNAILREIRQLATSSNSYSVSLSILYVTLGRYIYRKYEFQRKKKAKIIDNVIRVYNKYLEWYIWDIDKNVNGRVKWQHLAHEASMAGRSPEMTIPEWPRYVLTNVGKFLYNIILNNVKIPHITKSVERQIPAFYILFRNKNDYYLTEEIKSHPYLSRIYNDSTPKTLTFETVLLPTCAPPRPWVNMDIGGFLLSKTSVVRDSGVGSYLLRNTPTRQLYPVLDCLNQLGSIPWRINKPVLDILIQIFREGGSEELNVPQPSSSLPPLSQFISDLNEQSKNKIMRLTLEHKRKRNEMYSLWCDCLYKLSVANHFRNKVFWLPHNLDFRGRAYPVPPHLTHLASDLGRSILLFAQKKPLGPKGLDWLKIHTINLTGLKKREPLHKRLEYANEILDQIVDSARNPMNGKRWWTKSEEPWQTLAVCMEINKALQSPNPEEYATGIAIYQDGSCNGLQHYAALGRDQIGAQSVNLYPSDVPQDVYSVVAVMVDEYRKKDAENGHEIAQALEGFVTRKVIKQTVMTTVYGVTKFGAKLQITRQLSDLKNFPQEHIWKGSLYLVELTFKSLRTMFTSAKEIQDWFTDCARIISTRCDQCVQWVTPLGLPVLQPYSKSVKQTRNKNLNLSNTNHNKTVRSQKRPDSLKQRNAFPPNFIHSLDSSHMMLTSLHCEQAGITFMSVHDCFWTHPCSVDIMNKICREQFIALHSEPILEDLATFLHVKYEKHFQSQRLKKSKDSVLDIFKTVPKKGDFDINKVLTSTYFFS